MTEVTAMRNHDENDENNIEVHGIKLLNNSGKRQNFIVFAPPPDTERPGAPDVYLTPVWRSKTVDSQGYWDIHMTNYIYAWAGRGYIDEANAIVQVEESLTANIGSSTVRSSTFQLTYDPQSENPKLNDDKSIQHSPVLGGFEICIKSGFDTLTKNGLKYLYGFGKADVVTGLVAPCTASVANKKDSETVKIVPVIKLYIAAYDAAQGQIIKFEDLGKVAACIDFSYQNGANFCTVIWKDNATHDTVYTKGFDLTKW